MSSHIHHVHIIELFQVDKSQIPDEYMDYFE